MNKVRITEFAASLLILLFSYTALSKWIAYDTFVSQLGKSPFVGNYARVLGLILPALEFIVVLGLVFKKTRLYGFYAAFFLMTLFSAYIYAMLNFSYDLPCSCGGVLAQMNWQ